ncbi:MAG: DUF4403 family protein [Bacteroidia bacterium]
MNIHFRLSLQSLSDFLNQRFEHLIFEGDLPKANAWAKVVKYAPMSIDGEGDKIYVRVPLQVEARLTLREKIFGDMLNILPKLEKTKFRMTAHFAVRLHTDDDWNLQTFTLGTFKWETPPEVGIGPLKMKITSFLRSMIQEEVEEAATMIDQAIAEEVQLRQRLEAIWKEVQMPFQVHDDPPVWLHIRPQAVAGKREALTCDHIAVDTAISLPLGLNLMTQPSQLAEYAALPSFGVESTIGEDFKNTVQTRMHFASLSKHYDGAWIQTGESEEEKAQIQNLKLGADEDIILMEMDLNGVFKVGPIFSQIATGVKLSFKLFLEQNHIHVSDISVDLQSSNLMIKALNQIGKKYLIKKITALFQEVIGMVDTEVRKNLEEAFEGTEISESLMLKGRVDVLKHRSLMVETHAIKLDSELDGHMTFYIAVS